MIRKIFFLVFTAVVAAFLYYGYTQFRRTQQPKTEIYSFVPVESSLILEIDSPFDQWEDLLSNNIIWDELQVFTTVDNIEQQIIDLDSAIQQNNLSRSIFEEQKIIVSMVIDSLKVENLVIQTRYSTQKKPIEVAKYLQAIFSIKLAPTELPNDQFTFKWKDEELHTWIHDGVISMSLSAHAINTIIAQRADKRSLLTNTSFKSVRKTSSKDAKLKVFVHSNRLRNSILPLLNSTSQKEIILMPQLITWAELDVDIKPDEISLSGFSSSSDSLQTWLSMFKNQEAIKPLVVDFLPDRTAFLLHFGFSNFATLRASLVARLSNEIGSNYDYPISVWDTAYDISVEDDFIDWIDNEVALAITEPDQPDLTNHQMVWVNTSDSRTVLKHLSEMALKVTNKQEGEFLVINYKGYTIQKLEIPDFLAVTLGLSFKSVTENYFTQIGDYIVFANTPYSLQWTINKLEQGKTLANDAHFTAYRNRISNESNVFLYSNIAQSPYIYQSVVNKDLHSEISEQQEWLRKFQVFSLQLSYENDDLFYANNYFKYNPVYKKETNSIWELALDTSSLVKPIIVKNHYTQAPEIFTQDDGNTIYRISNKGKVLWKRNLGEKILSPVTEIDMYKNQKLQMVFSTANHIYIIDRNGKDVSGFPISLPDSASAQLTVMDYENNKDYRFIIPLNNGELINYGINGKMVRGWSHQRMKVAASQAITHIKIQQKDYLISVTKDGSIIGLNRRGEPRLKIHSKFNFAPKGDIKIQVGSTLANSYVIAVTSNNEVVKISLDDIKTRLFAIKMADVKFTSLEDIDLDGAIEIVATNDTQIHTYETDGKIVSEFTGLESIQFAPNFYHYMEIHKMGYVDGNNNRIYLTDFNGQVVFGFPLKGNTPFTISDINNDGRFNVITVDSQGMMYAYTMQ